MLGGDDDVDFCEALRGGGGVLVAEDIFYQWKCKTCACPSSDQKNAIEFCKCFYREAAIRSIE